MSETMKEQEPPKKAPKVPLSKERLAKIFITDADDYKALVAYVKILDSIVDEATFCLVTEPDGRMTIACRLMDPSHVALLESRLECNMYAGPAEPNTEPTPDDGIMNINVSLLYNVLKEAAPLPKHFKMSILFKMFGDHRTNPPAIMVTVRDTERDVTVSRSTVNGWPHTRSEHTPPPETLEDLGHSMPTVEHPIAWQIDSTKMYQAARKFRASKVYHMSVRRYNETGDIYLSGRGERGYCGHLLDAGSIDIPDILKEKEDPYGREEPYGAEKVGAPVPVARYSLEYLYPVISQMKHITRDLTWHMNHNKPCMLRARTLERPFIRADFWLAPRVKD